MHYGCQGAVRIDDAGKKEWKALYTEHKIDAILDFAKRKNMIIFTSQVVKMPLNLGKQLLRGKTNKIFASEKCPPRHWP